MKKLSKKQSVVLAAIAVLTLAGCTTVAAASAGWNGHHTPMGPAGQSVSLDTAKAAALTYLDLTPETAYFVPDECELEHGVYELELWADGVEYDCEVDATTGAVLQAARDWDDEEGPWDHHEESSRHHSGHHHADWDD